MDRHAYLIVAHAQFDLLGKELEMLDHPRNDFFIHIDKRSQVDLDELRSHVHTGRVFFIPRICVYWGGPSLIEVTMELLRAATQTGCYAYYHFMSGADLPLCPQSQILDFFDSHQGTQFISIEPCPISEKILSRIRYYYPAQELFKSRESLFSRIIRRGTLAVQKAFRVNRIKLDLQKIGVGSAFFDITDDFARYVVAREAWMWEHFSKGFCADEMFIQTLYLHWEGDHSRYRANAPEHPYIQRIYLDVMRAIDWTRGTPYVWRAEDLDTLLSSGCLFARKFDNARYPQIVDILYQRVLGERK